MTYDYHFGVPFCTGVPFCLFPEVPEACFWCTILHPEDQRGKINLYICDPAVPAEISSRDLVREEMGDNLVIS